MKNMAKKLIRIACLSALFFLSLTVYMTVWFSGDLDGSEYIGAYRVLVSGCLALSFLKLKKAKEEI